VVKDVAPNTTVIGVAAHKTVLSKNTDFTPYGINLKAPDPYDKRLNALEEKIVSLQKELAHKSKK
jgi:hypothetical protein